MWGRRGRGGLTLPLCEREVSSIPARQLLLCIQTDRRKNRDVGRQTRRETKKEHIIHIASNVYYTDKSELGQVWLQNSWRLEGKKRPEQKIVQMWKKIKRSITYNAIIIINTATWDYSVLNSFFLLLLLKTKVTINGNEKWCFRRRWKEMILKKILLFHTAAVRRSRGVGAEFGIYWTGIHTNVSTYNQPF
jgi:hypothetical protein